MTGISTSQSNIPLSNKDKIAALKEKHAAVFAKLGITEPIFLPKMGYPFGGEKVMSFFVSELAKESDIFTEFVDRNYNSEDPTRTLYKWTYNPNYKTAYVTKPLGATGEVMYQIPTSELIEIKAIEESVEEEFDLPDPSLDLPFDQMTIRDYAAIHWKKPISFKNWLNELIKNQK